MLEKIFSIKSFPHKFVISIMGMQFVKYRVKYLNQEIVELKKDIKSISYAFQLITQSIQLNTIECIDSNLKKLQQFDSQFLDLFANVCEKENITFWLDFGTLLGAERHNGFIPWDDDIDIAMLRSDYDKIDELHERYLKNKGISLSNGAGFYHKIKRLKYKNTPIQIDIWPYDLICDNKNDINVISEKIRKCNQEYCKRNSQRLNDDINVDILKSIRNRKLNITDSISKSTHLVNGCEWITYSSPRVYKINHIFPLVNCRFGERNYLVPNNAKYVLYDIYGDYKKFPSVTSFNGHWNICQELENFDIEEHEILELKKSI